MDHFWEHVPYHSWIRPGPATPGLAPWLRSLSLNGAYKAIYDERAERAKVNEEVRAEIEAEQRQGK